MTVKVFLCAEFRKSLDDVRITQLVELFKQYKTSGIPPASWGRDEPYDLVASIKATGLAHIHLKDSTSKHWHLNTMQFNKKSNTALVYCQGYYDKNKYLLIAFFENAHEIARENLLYMMKLGDTAEDFRNKY